MIEAARNLLTEWARLVARSLVSAGVRDIIVSPGSRSTPFVLALHRERELRLTSVIDERVAAFVALGIGRATSRPAAVLATSGTAPAHWLPAVIEASLTNVPMLLLSANRPLALANAGAAQTIDQTKLFGSWVRLFVDVGDPRADRAALEGVVRSVGQAVAVAHTGPVHLDLHADKPLEPVEASSESDRKLAALAMEVHEHGVSQISFASRGADTAFSARLADALTKARRPIVLCGPRLRDDDVAAIHRACAKLEVVVAAEATSQLRYGPRGRRAIDASETTFSSARFAQEQAPDLVIQIGSLPTAPMLERAWSSATRFILDAGGIHDPIGGARAISTGPAGATLEAAATSATGERDDAWMRSLDRAESIAWSEVERSISSGRGEGPVVRAALAAAPSATLVIGNSLPIRTLDRFVPGGGAARRVISQRGANGIDGIISGAIGVSIASTTPVLAIVGDVSFVHDLNALCAARSVLAPLVIVVIDNGGGRIFDSLPIARVPEMADAMALFTTPHDIDLAGAARAFGVPCVETRDASETARAVLAAMATPRLSVIRAIVDPDDARRAFTALVSAFEARFYGGNA